MIRTAILCLSLAACSSAAPADAPSDPLALTAPGPAASGSADAGTVQQPSGDARVPPSGPSCNHSLAAGDVPGSLVQPGSAGDRTRTWVLHVPKTAAESPHPMPLVILLHGGGGTAASFEKSTAFDAKADAAGFLVAHPDGVGDGSGKEFWNGGPVCGIAAAEGVDDVGFLRSMIATIEAQTCVDPKQIFVTGFSEGALLSHRLGCQMSDLVAAIAPVSGGLSDNDPSAPPSYDFACAPTSPISVFEIHGTADCNNPFFGGSGDGCKYDNPSIPRTQQRWAAFDGCTSERTTYLTEPHPEGRLKCTRFAGCPTGVDVELCALENGTHGWPGSTRATNPCNGATAWSSWSATDAVWDFFAHHAKP